MTKSALLVVAAALLLGGTSLASAKNRGAAGAHSRPSRPSINEMTPSPSINEITPSPSINEITPRPSIDETTRRPTAADPYYRLSDSYYGYSDPYHGLFDFFAVPPNSPGYAYGHVRPRGWR